jgi:hypothetical protein
LAGHTLAYEPAAVVWHHHRSDLDGLRRQMFAYGTGLSAFLTKHLLDRTTRRAVLRRIPRGLRRAAGIAGRTHRSLGPETDSLGPETEPLGPETEPLGPEAEPLGPEAEPLGPGAAPVPTTALLLRELAGLAVGPLLYARARRAVPPVNR